MWTWLLRASTPPCRTKRRSGQSVVVKEPMVGTVVGNVLVRVVLEGALGVTMPGSDRRGNNGAVTVRGGGPVTRKNVLDDPVEKAKADARAKKFGAKN
ncbi:unnamed protein product [Tuber aestivum]|uniref:Uncharacterized protein n=1 Tax=Tuber aestivum TaxID=59557 RepID=A0A292PRU9_9PEZI|nr:unnamed protein product [Tuber aestivum]